MQLHAQGAKVVAVSDVQCAIVNTGGLDIPALCEHCELGGVLAEFAEAEQIPRDDLLTMEVDILIPAALENAITAGNAADIKARIIGEGANGPVTPEAVDILAGKDMVVIPDILANAGGVTVSYFEWVQNRQEFYWPEQRVNDELKRVMVAAYRQVADLAKSQEINLREAAYRIAIERVTEAALRRGVQ